MQCELTDEVEAGGGYIGASPQVSSSVFVAFGSLYKKYSL